MRILAVCGTRPEAIKLVPVCKALMANSFFDVKVCVTGQHRHMLDQVLNFFEIKPDFDLNIMQEGQNLTTLTVDILQGLDGVIQQWRPQMVLVHGDTTTSFVAALSAYYAQIPVGHVEAGLRTKDRYSPFPEEINRTLTGHIAHLHFAPTEKAKQNLIAEGIEEKHIYITGNTVIDALLYTTQHLDSNTTLRKELEAQFSFLQKGKKTILVTGHRRENFGLGFENICSALAELATRFDVQLVYPVHLNPNVQEPVERILGSVKNCVLFKPLEYVSFVYLMQQSYLILSDSGGIQEEATALGKPILVMRNITERPEAVAMGTAKLVGTNTQEIVSAAHKLLDDEQAYASMSRPSTIFGDGKAAMYICDILQQYGAKHRAA